MKYLYVFSIPIVGASVVPAYIFIGKAKWFPMIVGKLYVFGIAPMFFTTGAIALAYMFISGRHVSRLASGTSLILSLPIIYVAALLATGVSGLAMQGGGH